jgi:hypothetical protein
LLKITYKKSSVPFCIYGVYIYSDKCLCCQHAPIASIYWMTEWSFFKAPESPPPYPPHREKACSPNNVTGTVCGAKVPFQPCLSRYSRATEKDLSARQGSVPHVIYTCSGLMNVLGLSICAIDFHVPSPDQVIF